MFLLLLSFLAIAQANELVITLDKNEKAPFAGTLLNPEAAARILSQGESELQECLITAKRDLAVQDANFKLQLANKEAAFIACTTQQTRQKQLYEEHIKYLEQRAIEPHWKAPTMFAGGVVTGIVVILVSAYALDKIGD